MGRSSSSSCKQENDPTINFANHSTGFLHLPELESPTMNPNINDDCSFKSPANELMPSSETSDWVTLDRLVASQLNGQPPQKQFSGYADDDFAFSFDQDDQVHQLMNMNNDGDNNNNPERANESETDLWNFGRSSSSSSSDPLCHLSV